MQLQRRTGFAWPELLLALAAIALVLQLFPSLATTLLAALDFRAWPRGTWFAANVLVLIGLVGVRFGPELYADWQARRRRLRGTTHAAADGSEQHQDPNYEARVRRDADWRERAKKAGWRTLLLHLCSQKGKNRAQLSLNIGRFT